MAGGRARRLADGSVGDEPGRELCGLPPVARPWHVPTFSVVFADVDGNIGYQATGRIPLRHRPERGYRAEADAADQWDGLISFEHMPGVINPSRGFVVTANNRVADDSFPYPLAGTWTSGYRAERIREATRSAADAHARQSSAAAAGRVLAPRGRLCPRTVCDDG